MGTAIRRSTPMSQRRIVAITGVLIMHTVLVGALLLPRQPLEWVPPPPPAPDYTISWAEELPPPPPPPPPPPQPVELVRAPSPVPIVAPPTPMPAPVASEPNDVIVDTPTSTPISHAPIDSTLDRVSGALAPGELVRLQTRRAPVPPYPRRELARGIEGQTRLRVLVGLDGRPQEISVLRSSGNRNLDLAAIRGVKRWLFRPYTVGGIPRPVWAEVPVNFKID